MKVFITGASGWIGSATVDELVAHGHDVEGLARSEASAAAIAAKGARVRRGDLDDLAGVRAGAADADAVIHLANKHDFVHPGVSDAAERGVVQAILDVLEGSDGPFLLASGMAVAPGSELVESDASPHHGAESMRGGTENLALDYVDRGVGSVPVRFAPTVHGAGDHGFTAVLAAAARASGAAVYVGDGASRWPAVHISDAARVVRLGLEKAPAGSILHAAAESGVPTRDIAEALGAAIGVPAVSVAEEEAAQRLGFIGMIFSRDLPASSAATRALLGWEPTGPTLLDDIRAGHYRG